MVKASAKRLLAHLHDKLVLDWRRKAATTADVRTTIRDVLDADLPADPYPPEVFDAKVQAVFDHIATAYGDDGSSVYDGAAVEPVTTAAASPPLAAGPVTVAALTEEVVEQLRHDAEFVALVAEKLGLTGKPELRTIDELIDNDEDYAVEFKSTARWDLRENQPSKAMEDAIVKTVAGFLNTDGGTLLIGIGPDRQVVGLDHDYAAGEAHERRRLRQLADHPPHQRPRPHPSHPHPSTDRRPRGHTRSAASTSPPRPRPCRAKTSKADQVFFVRMNNSTPSAARARGRGLPGGALAGDLRTPRRERSLRFTGRDHLLPMPARS